MRKDQKITLPRIKFNLDPEAFHKWAGHYYKCKQDFKNPDQISPVPYFLLCRSIELAIKSKHLENNNQSVVKDKFMHDLIKAYKSLNKEDQVLSSVEVEELKKANAKYCSKGFEYFMIDDALRGYEGYPNLTILDAIAEKLLIHTNPTK